MGHELRALTLGMLHHGAGEGMLPIKWNTTKRIIRCSKRFGLWLQKQNINALHLLDSLPALRLRHLIDKYLTENNAQKHLHVAQDISSALYWWKLYGIVQSTKILTLFEEMLAPYIAKKSEYRQKHSIMHHARNENIAEGM